MGMTCTLQRATAHDIDRLREDPARARSFLGFDDAALPVRPYQPKGLAGLLLRWLPIEITEVAPETDEGPASPAIESDRRLDLDKAWHGLHFLLTGTADGGDEPANHLLHGGEPLDDDGEVRALGANEVRRFAEHLSAITPAELARRYDPERMTELDIYPRAIWMRTSAGDSPLEWLTASFADVQRLVTAASAAGEGLIIHIG